MEAFLQWLSANSVIATVVIVTLCILLIATTLIYLVAFFQGREISFYPPKIGKKPFSPATAKLSAKDKKQLEEQAKIKNSGQIREQERLELVKIKSDFLRKLVDMDALSRADILAMGKNFIDDFPKILTPQEKLQLLEYLIDHDFVTRSDVTNAVENLIADISKSSSSAS